MMRIPLRAKDGSVRAYALVDDADHPALTLKRRGSGEARWSLDRDGYAVRATWRDGRRVLLKMHRVILALVDPREEGDHENGNRLDNRRSNLRVTTRAQNAQNLPSRASSGHRNVYYKPERERYQVAFKVRGRTVCVGWFIDLGEAIQAAEAHRREVHPYAVAR